jgi:hypothetical protein
MKVVVKGYDPRHDQGELSPINARGNDKCHTVTAVGQNENKPREI